MTGLAAIDPGRVFVWGTVAAAMMAILLEGARLMRWSRMSLPFLFGAIVTEDRDRASLIGFALYMLGGWLFAFLYAWFFQELGRSNWWIGGLAGTVHGLWLLVVFLPLLNAVHPRMASEHAGPSARRGIEPPGPAGLNYGLATPAITLLGQVVYGAILGATCGPGG